MAMPRGVVEIGLPVFFSIGNLCFISIMNCGNFLVSAPSSGYLYIDTHGCMGMVVPPTCKNALGLQYIRVVYTEPTL